MSKYIIEGGKRLLGSLRVSGNKNAALSCIAACLLTEDEVVLKNIPKILDVDIILEIISALGARVDRSDHQVKISAKNLNSTILPPELTSKLRGSVLLAGSLLGRVGQVSFDHPGGDVIGKRGLDLHIDGFKKMGYQVESSDRSYKITRSSKDHKNCQIFLEIPTVTGTENLILAAALNLGLTTIRNAAQEPHVIDLCKMLNQMGAKISGIGSPTINIEGVQRLSGTEFEIGPDPIEFGTYAIAAGLTNGKLEFKNCQELDLEPIIWPLQKMGLKIEAFSDSIIVSSKKLTAIPRLIANVWPGFPTDLMSTMIVLATQAKGVSLMHDFLYESRMFFVDKLISMGANITIADPHRVLVYGPTKLLGRVQETPDIRAGMALVLASLIAQGTSVINRAELIERGYENVVKNLTSLGAKIERVE